MKQIFSILILFFFAASAYGGSIDSSAPNLGVPATSSDYVVTFDSDGTTNGKIARVPFSGNAGEYLDGTGHFVAVTAGVSSFNGRTGDVTPEQADYANYFLALAACAVDNDIPAWDGVTASWKCSSALSNHLVDYALHLTADQNAALDGANSPSASNVLATMADIQAGGSSTWLGLTDTPSAFIAGELVMGNQTADGLAFSGISVDSSGNTTFPAEVSADSFSVSQTATGPQYTQLYEDSDNGTDARGISAPPAITSSLLFQLPDGDPTAGQVITWGAPTTQTMSDGSTATVTVGTFADMSGGTGGYVAVPTYSDESCTEGEYAVDHTNGYIYRCIATDTWDRYAVTFDNWSNPTPVQYTLTVTDPGNNDAIQWDLAGADPIDCGNGVTDCTTTQNNETVITGITAVPASGREFVSWTGDITGTTATDGSATFSADITGSATFQAIPATADILKEDFEGTSGVTWTDTSTGGTVNHAATHTGTWGCTAIGSQALDITRDATTGAAYTTTTLASAISGGYLSILINASSLPNLTGFNDVYLVTIDDSSPGGFNNINVAVRYTGTEYVIRLYYRDSDGVSQVLGDSSAITLNEDHELQLIWARGAGAGDDSLSATLDGVSFGSLTTLEFQTTSDQYITLGDIVGGTDSESAVLQFDNIYISSVGIVGSCN